jgi:hypothetical protein
MKLRDLCILPQTFPKRGGARWAYVVSTKYDNLDVVATFERSSNVRRTLVSNASMAVCSARQLAAQRQMGGTQYSTNIIL